MYKVGIKRIKIRTFYVATTALIIGGAFSTYAQLSSQAYTVRTVHVFPSQIEAVGFKNAQTLTFQNLDGFALLQDFNAINSATLERVDIPEPEAPPLPDQTDTFFAPPVQIQTEVEAMEPVTVDPVTDATSTDQTDAATPTNTQSVNDAAPEQVPADTPTDAAVAPPAPEAVVEPVADEIEVAQEVVENAEPEPEPEPEAADDQPVDETTAVTRPADRLFALAIESLTETFSSTSPVSSVVEEVVEITPPALLPVIFADPTLQPATNTVPATAFGFNATATTATRTGEVSEVATGTEAAVEATDSPVITETPVASEVPAVLPEADTPTNEVESTDDAAVVEPIAVDPTGSELDVVSGTNTATTSLATSTPSQTLAEACEPNCTGHVLRLENFGYPLDEGVELSGAQLRMSFAAKQRAGRESIPSFTMNYSLDAGATWSTGGSVLLDDEASNSINGGYYLFALPAITEQATLEDLQVELRYDDDLALLDSLYVESVWLELFTLEPPESEIETDFVELLANDGFTDSKLSGDTLELPNGEEINFTFTDNNDGETLIIKSDQKTYDGLSEIVTYFNVTNTSDQADEFAVQTYFPNGVGEVTSLEVFNINKPRDAIVPEYRPYIYHCEAGWKSGAEVTEAPESLESFSIAAATSTLDTSATTTATTTDVQSELVEYPASDTATATAQVDLTIATDAVEGQFSCSQTSVVRTCDSLDGENTACVVSQKVKDHEITKYAPGWDIIEAQPGELGRGGVLSRVSSFFGFSPDRKDIPDGFEGRVHTDETFSIAPGETRYFKMDITFPAFSEGEWWIEAIGDREYGLLDPFWSSQWRYKMPLEITNPTGVDQTEFQVRLKLDGAMADFWDNIQNDGGDIRFIQEVAEDNLFGEPDVAGLLANNYDPAWLGRVALTIPASAVDATLSEFPVYVDLGDLGPDFWTGVQSDGRDIRITQADGASEVPYELVSINTGARTGELHFKAPLLDAGVNNVFHIYFNNSAASAYADTDPFGAHNVWTNNYVAVYHDGGGVDSTEFGRNANAQGGATAGNIAGQIGTATDLNGTSQFFQTASAAYLNGLSGFTTSMWIESDSVANQPIYTFDTAAFSQTSDNFVGMRFDSVGFLGGDTNVLKATARNTAGAFADGETVNNTASTDWMMLQHTWDGTTNQVADIYKDGAVLPWDAAPVALTGTLAANTLALGRGAHDGYWNGTIDAVRVSSVSRSADWIATEFVNQSDPTVFYATSTALISGSIPSDAPQWYSTSWEGRQLFTIEDSQIDSSIDDFPVYVDLSLLGSEFFNRVAVDGADVRITLADGKTEVPLELVNINTTTETGELYFKTDIVDGENNQFYVYFDNEDAEAYARSATYGSENVWTNGFRGVYHFEEEAAGTGNTNLYTDSTANRFHADDNTTDTTLAGRFGGGVSFGTGINDAVEPPNELIDGISDYTVSWWHNTTQTNDLSIISGANFSQQNEFLMFFSNPTTFNAYLNGPNESFGLADTVGSFNTGLWQHYLTTGEDAIDSVNLFVNGQGDTENPDPQPITQFSIPNGGLVIGQEQDAVNGSYDPNQRMIGQLDEFRVATVVRDAAWAALEYENMANNATFITVATAETLQPADLQELDHWVQFFDYSAEEAEIWVQIENLPAAGTTIYVYYGNSVAESASDELATFTYDTLTEVYYVVDDHGADSVEVTSLVDNNQVQLAGGTIIDLNRGETTSFASPDGNDGLSILGPVSAMVAGASADSGEMLVPIAFATTTFAIPTNRNTNRWYTYAPFADASVSMFNGASPTALNTQTVSENTSVTFANDITSDGAVFTADEPFLLMHRATQPADGIVAYPPTLDAIYGVNSNSVFVSGLTTGSDPTVSCSSGSGGTQTGITRGGLTSVTSCDNGADGSGSAVRFSGQSSPIAAIQQADSDGNESTVFWPEIEFGTQYALPAGSSYIAVVCAPRHGNVDLAVVDSLGNSIESGTCIPGATTPGKAYFTNSTNDNDAVNFAAGTLVVSTNDKPFYTIFEDRSDDDDEKNTQSPVQARKFGGDDTAFIAGPQEEANGPEYNQFSFGWYENNDELTPVNPWTGNGEPVDEAQNVVGAGALDEGDVIRLRVSVEVDNATSTAGQEAFMLQYTSAVAGQCGLVEDWFDVGSIGSSTAAFAGFNVSSLSDGSPLPSTLLASSTMAATYEERNFSDFVPTDIGTGQIGEWDWVLTASNINVNTNYCFRMVRASGVEFDSYRLYPQIETVGPPNTPQAISFFDNENTPVLTPTLNFVATDIAGDDIHYEIQIDDDVNFGSIEVEVDSATDFIRFEEADGGADKAPFVSGEVIRFNGTADLSDNTTYWWRVRASDPSGSATSSAWSAPFSYTTDTTVTVSEWLQTTSDQFNTNALSGVTVGSGQVSVAGASGQMIGTAIDFDDATVGNAWGEVVWNAAQTSGDITIQVQYNDNGVWQLVPDSALPGNSVGANSSPLNILGLDTATYNEIRLVANFAGTSLTLQDWNVSWGERVETPVLGDLFDNQKTADTLPVFDFVSADPQGDGLEYEISFSESFDFAAASSTFNSASDPGFLSGGAATSPFVSGTEVRYSTQVGAPFSDNTTYWWRVRAKDPLGGDAWSPWSRPDAFTVDTTVTLSTWFQTTRDQFNQGELDGTTATSSGSVVVSKSIGEYGRVTLIDNNWQTVTTNRSYSDMVVTASPELSFNGGNNGQTVRVRNKTETSFEIKTDDYNGFTGSTEVDYIVMEAGRWTIDDGTGGFEVIAATAEAVNDKQTSAYVDGVGRTIPIAPPLSAAPAVLATVASDNNSAWVGTHVDGGLDIANTVPTNQVRVALSLSKQTGGGLHTGAEDIDYMLFEPGNGSVAGTAYQVLNSGASVTHLNTAVALTGFATAPAVTVVHNNGENGPEGGYAHKDLDGPNTNTSINLSVSEQGAGADNHAANTVSIVAFEGAAGFLTLGGSNASTIAGEDIIFSDGAGPKFDNFSWLDTTPGSSETTYQLQYLVSEGVYALVPDAALPGNSTGFTTSPIDLTALDIDVYSQIRPLATLECNAGDCPTIESWQVEWSEGVSMAGRIFKYNRQTPLSETSLYNPAWLGSMEITIPAANVDATLTDFPVYVDLSDLGSSFWSGVQSDGRDIRMTSADGATELPFELVSMSAGTRTGELHFLAPTLSASSDTTYLINFNNPAAAAYAPTDPFGRNNVWTNGFEAVFHLQETGAGAVDEFVDSTGNGFDGQGGAGTAANVPTNAAGQLGRGQDIDGADDFITLNTAMIPAISGANTKTVSAWTNLDTYAGSGGLWNIGGSATGRDFSLRVNGGTNGWRTQHWGTPDYDFTYGSTGVWQHAVLSYDGVTSRATMDGVEIASEVAALNTQDNNSYGMLLGRWRNTDEIDGRLDEVRIASVARSIDWIAAEHDNQRDASTFYATSSAESSIVGQIRAAVNGVPIADVGVIATDGTWTLPNVTAFAGDTVTVWIDDAPDAQEAVTVFTYDGLGDITGVNLYELHLAISADELGTVTNAQLGLYDNGASGDEDIFFNVNGSNALTVCAAGVCSDANLYIGPGQTYIPATTTATTITTHDFVNDGTIELDNNTFNVSGSWLNTATSSADTSTINLTAASGSETITSTESPLRFHNLGFGGFGMATFTPSMSLDLSGSLTVGEGVFVRGNNDLNIGGNISTLVDGIWSGTGTTTFDGSGAKTWSDANAVPQNIGNVVIDGASTIVTIGSDVSAYDITIGGNDTLVGGTGNVITVGGDWTNNGTFSAQTSTVEIVVDDRVYPPVIPGSSDWYSNTAFVSRIPFTVESDEVEAAVTNFPVYVDLSTFGADFWTNVQTNGRDIRITTNNGQTELPVEVVEIDTVAETGELHFLADSLSDVTDTTFYVYFNNPAATMPAPTAPFGRNAVWADFAAVYHFSGDPTAIDNLMIDSSGNGYDLAVQRSALASVSGQMGTAVDLNGVTGYLESLDFGWAGGDPLTSSGWYQMSAVSNNPLWQFGRASNDRMEFWPWNTGNNGIYRFGNTGGSAYTFSPRETVDWNHFATVGDTAIGAGLNRVYHDRILRETQNQTVANPENLNLGGLQIGRNGTGGSSLEVVVDELRFATEIRNLDWITTEYNNQLTPGVFVTAAGVETYQPPITLDSPTHNITANGSAFYNLVLNDATTTPAFTEPSVVTSCDFTIATGTVALPTGKLTVGCSFENNGVFMHNNGEVEFSGSGSNTIELQGTTFLNAFYDVTFDGSGDWSFIDTNATTSNDVVIRDGSVTFPSGELTIGGTLLTTGGGGFDANSGTVAFTSTNGENVTTNGSSFNNVVFGLEGGFGWYDTTWTARERITIPAANVTATLTDFPVYIDLSTLGSDFWSGVAADGSDIRVTNGTGVTELPYEIVTIDTGAETGQLHFKADSLSSVTDSTFYLYYENAAATAYTVDAPFGRNNVWTNGYEAVFHLEESGDGTFGEYIDSTGNGYDAQGGTGVATDVPALATGQLGGAQDFENTSPEDHIDLNTSMIAGMAGSGAKSVSAWVNVESFSDNGGVWGLGANQTGEDFTLRVQNTVGSWRAQHNGVPDYNVTFGTTDVWYHMALDYDGITSRTFGDGVLLNSEASTLNLTDDSGYGVQIGRWRDNEYFDGLVDELRFSSVDRSAPWYAAEHLNQSNPGTFLSSESETLAGDAAIFTLNEDFTDIDGDLTLQGAQLIASQDTLTIGGSAFNAAGVFDANNATTTFDSTNLGETFDFGGAAFHNLAFNGVGGGWTVGTTTVNNNLTLVTGASYVQAPNTTMSVGGTFSNQFAAANTDWTDSTLVLTGGDYTVTDRNGSGDDYATLRVSGDTDIVIWNSTIASSTIADNSSIYMPDYGATNGLLRIYGDYERSVGTEHWSYATDFDGTDLTGGSERTVSVEIADGSTVSVASTSALEMVGASGATTTVESIAGNYALVLNEADLAATLFSITDTDTDGLQLLNGTTISQLTAGEFLIATNTAITVDAATIEAQPSSIYSNLRFQAAAGTPNNVTLNGIPSAFWSFAAATGDRAGESFDADDGDPGAIQWDDSNFTISISGVVYDDDGVTPTSAPVCNGVTNVVTVVVDGTDTYSAPCSPFDGSYTVTGVTYVGNPKIVTYIERNATDGDVVAGIMDQNSGVGTGSPITVERGAVVDGTVLVAIIGKDDDLAVTAPAGWVAISSLGNTTGDSMFSGAWYKVVSDASTEPTSYDFTHSDGVEGYSYWVGSLVNVDTASPIDVSAGWTKLQNDSSPAVPAVTTTQGGTLVITSWFVDNDPSLAVPLPSNWDLGVTNLISTIDDMNLSVLTSAYDSIVTTDALEAQFVANRESQVFTVAFAPAAAPSATSSMVAAAVTQTPIGSTGNSFETISLRDETSGAGDVAAAATVSATAPTTADNDVLIAVFAKEDDFDMTPPAGWTEIAELVDATENDMYTGAWYRVVTDSAAEPTTYDFISNDNSTEEYSYWIGSYRNVNLTTPIDVPTAWTKYTTAPGGLVPASSITTVTDKTLLIAAWFVLPEADIDMPVAPWETRVEDLQSGTSQRTLGVSTRPQAVAGATGNVEISSVDGGDDTQSIQIALRPRSVSVASEIVDMDLYQNRVIVRHEDIAPLTILDMAGYTNSNEDDLPFTTSAPGFPGLLTVLDGAGLYVWNDKTFNPGGEIILEGVGSTPADGSFRVGPGATFNANGTNSVTIGGSLYVDTAGTYNAATSRTTFTATNPGQQIGAGASSTINLYDTAFTGVGGNWAIQTPIVVDQDILASTGTISGVSNVTVVNGDFSGNGLVAMTSGTVQMNSENTLGGINPWTFYNLTLGNGADAGVTTPATSATTTITNQLRINSGHFLDALGSTWDLTGNGSVFVESGQFLEGASTVRYSGTTPTILRTAYHNLVIDTESGGSVTAVAPVIGLQVLGDLTVGAIGTSTLNSNTNDPLVAVRGDVYIGTRGVIAASDVSSLNVFGDWDNDGTFVANGGLVQFLLATGTATIAAGNSPFADVTIVGGADYTMTESATTTGDMQLTTDSFTLRSGESLAVGGVFKNDMDDSDTTWTGTTLRLFGNQAYIINPKLTGDTYDTIEVSSTTHPRFWNSDAATITTEAGSSLYSMNHAGVVGNLNIYGDLVSSLFDDHWSYAEDFDGATLVVPRTANVQVEDGGSVLYTDGSLTVLGTTTASTSIAAQGVGPFTFTLSGSTEVDMNYYTVREVTSAGLTLTGAPSIQDLSFGDFEPASDGATAITVAGSVINANQAQNFTNMRFATTSAISATNVTATGIAVSSWRFVNVIGNLDGEALDVDPGGDPGYLVWEDSAAIIDISGQVFQSDRVSTSNVCNGTTENVRLVVGTVGAVTFASTTCDATTGAYTFTGVGFGPSDTLMVYIDGEPAQAVNVTKDPISLISNLDLYENHVIVRHESSGPMNIAAMSVYDSSEDADIPFTAVNAAVDTLTLPSDTALVVWNDKTFAPQGNMTLSGGGAGASFDGTLELFTDAVFDAGTAELHSIGGDLITGLGATFDPDTSTTTFTATELGRTIDTNDNGFHNVAFTGSGSWTILDSEGDINNDLLITAGTVTLPAATTTISGSFTNTGGAFVASAGSLVFDATDTGNTVIFGGSDPHTVSFTGGGSWLMGDINATTTDSFTVATGTVTLPTGVFAVTEDFTVTDTVAHAGGAVRLIGTVGTNSVTLSGNDLHDLTISAVGGEYVLTDPSATFLGSLTIATGTFTVGTGTIAIGDSFDVSGGVFANGTGTLLFNSADAGEFIDPGNNDLHNVVIAGTGGWTLVDNATTTNNFSLVNAGSFVVTPGTSVYVGGVFTNNVGGTATTWTDTTLVLDGNNEYETGVKTTSNERYGTLQLGENTDISSWNSSAATVTVPISSSWYSQDNAGVDGDLYIYGDYRIGTTTEFWSAGRDFDGAILGSNRQANVSVSSSSAVTLAGGTLAIVGAIGATTTIQNQGVGTFALSATGGTLNANGYEITDLNTAGLTLSGSVIVPSLSNGYFTAVADNANLITLVRGVINNNASLLIADTGFDSGGFSGAVNVSLDATTTNSWRFAGASGNRWGEAFDVDGTDECSSIRWDDSACLLTEQTNYRWRNDDGGEGAIDSEWFNTDWSARQRVRVINADATTYTDTAVKIDVAFDADMQSDFEDLRFTASDGVTPISHWIERVVVSPTNKAIVWIKAPTLPADTVSEFYMYYGNVAATSTSDGGAVMAAIEDFEANTLDDYTGATSPTNDKSLFETNGTLVYGGGFGLNTTNPNARTVSGIVNDNITVSQGQIIRYMKYIDPVGGTNDEACTIFASTGAVTATDNYAICTSLIGTEQVTIERDVSNAGSSGTTLATANANFTAAGAGWYEFVIDWETDNTIDLTVRLDSNNTLIATSTVIDSTYTSGGVGFSFWFQNGAWDSLVAYPRTETTPRVFLGNEQARGGATWANTQNTPTGGFAFGQTARLRVAIENSGLPIEDQRFQLEFAPKLTAATCEAVDQADYVNVPNIATCGSSAVCMATSPNVSNAGATSDHLVTAAGDFAAGLIVTSPNSRTGLYDLAQNRYTELEYAVQLTTNATNDAYCFRVTDDGTELDSYSNLPELTLAFDPVLDPVVLNEGLDIALTGGTTTPVIASTTVTDFNGFADLVSATTTFFTNAAGPLCTPNDNDCYVATSTCSFTNCSGTACTLQCVAPFAYHTNPTDQDGANEWFAFMEVRDQAGGSDLETSQGVELLTLRMMNVVNAIGYGIVDINEDTGSFNPDIQLLNIGNESIDVQISGTDMTDGVASVIPAAQQRFSTSTFTYASCIGCNALSVTPVNVEVDLDKPLTTTPAVSDTIFWGIQVPFGTASNPHTGVNFFTAIGD